MRRPKKYTDAERELAYRVTLFVAMIWLYLLTWYLIIG